MHKDFRWDKPQQHVIKQVPRRSRAFWTAETCWGVQATAGSMSIWELQCWGVAFGKDATGRCSRVFCYSGQMVVMHFTAQSNCWGHSHYWGFMCQQMTKHLIFKSVWIPKDQVSLMGLKTTATTKKQQQQQKKLKPLKTSVNFLVTETNESSTFGICLVTRL